MSPTPSPLVDAGVEASSGELLAFVGGIGAALIGALVAAVLTYIFTRRHAVRTERRDAYAKFLRFIDHIPTNIIFEVRSEDDLKVVATKMVRSIKDSEIELELIESPEVCKAVDAVYEVLISSDTAGLLSQDSLARLKSDEGVPELVMQYRDAISDARAKLVQAMRKDLGVKALPDEHFSGDRPTPQ